jgi:hypothetical protein
MVMGLIFIRHTLKLICQPVKDWKNAELGTTGIEMAYKVWWLGEVAAV